MKTVELFTDIQYYSPEWRKYLHPLLKPFVGKPPEFDDAARKKMYEISEKDFHITASSSIADIAVLPMAWNFYHETGQINRALDFIRHAQQHHLKVLSINSGDTGVKIPKLKGVIVHRSSGYRSKLPAWHQGMPVFFSDPLEKFFRRKSIIQRKKEIMPVIGFCGQSTGTWFKYTLEIVRIVIRNIKYHLKLSPLDSQSIQSHTLLRSTILDLLEKDPRLNTDFIKRTQYRAGARNQSEINSTSLEFFNNIVHTDYTVCIRGGGNFSTRFYQVLSMGRIPLFINTDCLLPLSDEINWKKHVIWVEFNEIDNLYEKILQFHHGLSKKDFLDIQFNNRKLWRDKLSLLGFYQSAIHSIAREE